MGIPFLLLVMGVIGIGVAKSRQNAREEEEKRIAEEAEKRAQLLARQAEIDRIERANEAALARQARNPTNARAKISTSATIPAPVPSKPNAKVAGLVGRGDEDWRNL